MTCVLPPLGRCTSRGLGRRWSCLRSHRTAWRSGEPGGCRLASIAELPPLLCLTARVPATSALQHAVQQKLCSTVEGLLQRLLFAMRSDELLAGVRLHRIGDYNLGWVEGRVGPPADGSEVRWWQACESSCVPQRATTLTLCWLARGTAHTHDIECGARPSVLSPQSQLPQLLPAEGADGGAADGGYGGVFIGDVRLSGGWMGQVMWAVVGHTPLPCPDADVLWVITRLPASNGSAFEAQLAHTPIAAAVLPAPQS